MIRILLVEDHPAVREAVRMLLELEPDLCLVGQAVNGPEALTLACELRPDVVLMDVSLPGLSGVEATRRLHADLPAVRIIALSAHEPLWVAEDMRRAGACAYVDKFEADTMLVPAIRQVMDGAADAEGHGGARGDGS